MIYDQLTTFAEKLSLAAGILGNTVDLKTSGRDLGQGGDLFLQVIARSDISGACAFDLVTSDDAALAGAVSILSVPSQTNAKSGTRLFGGAVPSVACKRYLGLKVTGAGTGKVSAFLTLDPNGWRAYGTGMA